MLIKDVTRVLFYLFFPAGGIGKYTHQLLEELAGGHGLDIEVVCLPNYQWRDTDSYHTWPGLFGISNRFPPLRKLRFLLGQFINPHRLLRRAKKTEADIIHICNINYLSFPFWRRALDQWGGRLACTAHDVRRQSAILNRRWEEKQLKAFYRRCDVIFVHGSGQVDELREFAGVDRHRIQVVPHGPTAYAEPPATSRAELKVRYGIPGNQQVALFFGFLRREKNLDGLLRALADTGSDDIHLYIAGNTPPGQHRYVQQCRELARSLGLEQRVTFDVRYVPDDELPALMKLCDWVALPYHPSFTSQSGVLNLAAFYQRPVLATPSAGFSELLQQAAIGEVCPGFEDADLVAGIRRICASMRQEKAWDFAGYRMKFSWSRNAVLTRDRYLQLMEPSAA